MVQLIGRIPRYWLAHRFGLGAPLPANVTIGLTSRCNSQCRTCRIYERPSAELTPDEWRRIFASLGRAPYWFTFSGGEPFLRQDTPEIVCSALGICRPGVANIPTNGLLTDRIVAGANAVCTANPHTQIIINVSLDDIGERHDEVRGVPGCYEKAVATVTRLQALGHANLTVGIHTVISRFNAADMARIVPRLLELGPDSYVTEVAEQRVELGTIGLDIAPDAGTYSEALDHVERTLARDQPGGVSGVVRAFRHEYYAMARRYARLGEMAIPCYAGLASAQIAPNGDVWFCCTRAESVGNLVEAGYDFRQVWRSAAAARLRQSIRRRECACPLANAAYTNMLCHPPALARVIWRHLSSHGPHRDRVSARYSSGRGRKHVDAVG